MYKMRAYDLGGRSARMMAQFDQRQSVSADPAFKMSDGSDHVRMPGDGHHHPYLVAGQSVCFG